MSDPHGAAPDPVDEAYAQSETLLDDEAARAARRARVLEATVQAPADLPSPDATARRRSPWRRGRWLAAASVAVFCGVLAMRIYEPIHQRLPGAELLPTAPTPLARPNAAAPAPAGGNTAVDASASPPSASRSRLPVTPHVSRPAPAPAPRMAEAPPPPVSVPSPPPLVVPPPPPQPPPPAPPPPPAAAPLPKTADLARAYVPSGSVGEVVVTGSRISRRAQAQRAAQASKLRDAAAAGKTDEVQGLLDQGIYVDTPDAKGITALMKSIQANQPETAGLLVRYGANLDKQDSDGVSARDRALKQADPELNQALGLGQ